MPSQHSNSKRTKRKPKSDKYQEQARRFIRLYFNPNTPAFIHDLLSQWYTDLETLTQVFWNHKSIAEVALPIMLREADERGIDVEALDTGFMSDVVSGYKTSVDGYREPNEPRSDFHSEQAVLERDAHALAHILNSPRIPVEVRNNLAEAIQGYISDLNDDAEYIQAAWPLAMLKKAAEGSGSHES
jgi:hypothetical protein